MYTSALLSILPQYKCHGEVCWNAIRNKQHQTLSHHSPLQLGLSFGHNPTFRKWVLIFLMAVARYRCRMRLMEFGKLLTGENLPSTFYAWDAFKAVTRSLHRPNLHVLKVIYTLLWRLKWSLLGRTMCTPVNYLCSLGWGTTSLAVTWSYPAWLWCEKSSSINLSFSFKYPHISYTKNCRCQWNAGKCWGNPVHVIKTFGHLYAQLYHNEVSSLNNLKQFLTFTHSPQSASVDKPNMVQEISDTI